MTNREMIGLAITGVWARIDRLEKNGGTDAAAKMERYKAQLAELVDMARKEMEGELVK